MYVHAEHIMFMYILNTCMITKEGGGHSFKCLYVRLFKCLYSHTLTHPHTLSHTHSPSHTLTHIPLHTHPCTPSHTLTHTPLHIPTQMTRMSCDSYKLQQSSGYHANKESATSIHRRKHQHQWYRGLPPLMLRYVYNTWCHHDVTIDNDVHVSLVSRPHPQNDTTLIS